jgi:hypothetical protein
MNQERYAINHIAIQEPEARFKRFKRLERLELVLSAARYRQAAQARSSQPSRNATPPIGVMAPSQRVPVKLKM